MLSIRRTNASDQAFINLVEQLDADLAIRDRKEHGFYATFNTLQQIKYVVLAYDQEQAVGCGAIKAFDDNSMEVKRMFTLPTYRGKGVAGSILRALENWAKELYCTCCILETGKRQPEAIALYLKAGYQQIPNYGQYAGIENSLCFKKLI
jgi:GNAT superfamily N-acetyltransferase